MFAIYGENVKEYWVGGEDFDQWGPLTREDVRTFDSVQKVVEYLSRTSSTPYGPISIHEIEEVPGETQREIVELEGVVDFEGLRFAVAYDDRGARLIRFSEDGHRISGEPTLFGNPLDAYKALIRAGEVHGYGEEDTKVVGIRETTTGPTRRFVRVVE